MPPMNFVFDVPLWILKGLESGEYVLNGGVVQDKAGKVVKWLQLLGSGGEQTLVQAVSPYGPVLIAGQALNLVASAAIYGKLCEVEDLVHTTLAAVREVQRMLCTLRREQLVQYTDPVLLAAELFVQAQTSPHGDHLRMQARGHATSARMQLTRVLRQADIGVLLEMGEALKLLQQALIRAAMIESMAHDALGEPETQVVAPFDAVERVFSDLAEKLATAHGRLPRRCELDGLRRANAHRILAEDALFAARQARHLRAFATEADVTEVHDEEGRLIARDFTVDLDRAECDQTLVPLTLTWAVA